MSPSEAANLNRESVEALQGVMVLLVIGFIILVVWLTRRSDRRKEVQRMWARSPAVRQVVAFSAPALDDAGATPAFGVVEALMALLRAEGVKLTEPEAVTRGWRFRARYENQVYLISVGAPLVASVVHEGGREEEAFDLGSPLGRFLKVFHAALSKDQRLQGLAWTRLKGSPPRPPAAHPLADFELPGAGQTARETPAAVPEQPAVPPPSVERPAPVHAPHPRRELPRAPGQPRPLAMVVSDYPDDAVWDENDDIARPGCHNLCEAIIAAMAPLGWSVGVFVQRNDFQWEFNLKRDGERFGFVTHDLGEPEKRGFSAYNEAFKPFDKAAKDAALATFLASLHDALMADPRIHRLIWSYDFDPDEDEAYDYPSDQ